ATISIGFPLLRAPNNEQDPPNDRDEPEELKPTASIGIVQTARRHRDARQERRDRKYTRQVIANGLKSRRSNTGEQNPPPELRPRCAAVEVRIFGETDFHRLNKRHR